MGFSLGGILNDLLGSSDPLGTKATQASNTAQLNASKFDLATQKELFNILQESKQPVLNAQNYAIDYLGGIGNGTQQLATNPSLQYQLDTGLNDIATGAAAHGKYNSGGRYVNQQDYASGLASQDTSQNIDRLLNLAGYSTNQVTSVNPLLNNAAFGQGTANLGIQGARNQGYYNATDLQNTLLNSGLQLGGAYAGYRQAQYYNDPYAGPLMG